MSDERQKKIETGKLKLVKFQKKLSAKNKRSPRSTGTDNSFQCSSIDDDDDKSEATNGSSNTSINTMKEKSETSLEKAVMDSSPIEGSAFPTFEDVSDDADPLLHAKQTALVSCLEQKLIKYQDASTQKDAIIKQLSQQLASSVRVSEAEDSETVEKFKEEINMLHLKMKETAGMIVKQNPKSNGKEILLGLSSDQVPCYSEIGIQVENSNPSLTEDDSIKTPSKIIPIPDVGDSCQKEQLKTPGDVLSIIKKIDSLTEITRLIESVANISVQSINVSSDFSPSKFQALFLKRLNSSESETTQIDVSENESQISEINYAEVKSEPFVKDNSCSVEKLRCHAVPQNLSLVVDYISSEMETINSTLKAGPQGDCDTLFFDESLNIKSISEIEEISDISLSNFEEILQRRSKLEAKILHLKHMQNDFKDISLENKSIQKDNFTNSDDNLIMEEPPLSCVSLLSLTDSEYRNEYITTDSEANFSRKVSLDSSKPAYDRDFCPKCDKYFELVKEKYDDHLCLLKESVENNLTLEKIEAVKKLELEIDKVKAEKDKVHEQMTKQIELLCQEQEMKIQQIMDEHQKQLLQIQECQNKWLIEKDQFILDIKKLEALLREKDKELHEAWNEKANVEISLQKQIADLVEEHQEDLEARHLSVTEQFSQDRKKIELEHLSSVNVLKKLHADELDELKESHAKELDELKQSHTKEVEELKKFHAKELDEVKTKDIDLLKASHVKELDELRKSHAEDLKDMELHLRKEHSDSISLIETSHAEECAAYQKRIERLLEEKCELMNKTTQEYETILKKNHEVLIKLCNQLRSKIVVHKKKILDESYQSLNSDLDASVADTLDVLNKSIEDGLIRFLEKNYFAEGESQEIFEETQYLELKPQFSKDGVPHLNVPMTKKEKIQKVDAAVQHDGVQNIEMSASEGSSSSISLNAEDIELIHSKTVKLQEDFQRDIAAYMEVNEQLRNDLLAEQDRYQELERQNKRLESQLLEKDSQLNEKESQLNSMETGSMNDVAQTNSRLIHVLSDLVKTFMDIEQDINRHLYEHGLIPSRSVTLGHHDEETGHSVGSREDFSSLSFGECPNLELAEDGPDLTPRAWDLFSAGVTYDHEMEGEDVVLGASRRLRQAVDHVLNLLTRALDNQQNQDLKLLLKRNEELSQELQDETKSRDDLHLQLIATEGTLRKLENEKQRLQDAVADLTESNDMLKREVTIERNKITYLTQEKEAANDEVQTLRSQCELLASRIGDPEKMSTNKTFQSEVINMHEKPELLQENSKLSSEKHNAQINLSKERQTFLDKLQQMEMQLEDLNAEKEEIMERKCKEIRDLKAEMEAMEKQLNSNKKFIEEQAQEREQEREDYLKEFNKMQEIVREKEKIQSNEAQLIKEIESLEQALYSRIDEHKKTMLKKDAVENELRQHVDKIHDLQEIIDKFEKDLNIKSAIETELRLKLSSLTETVNAHERRNSILGDELAQSRNVSAGDESTEQVQNLQDRLASKSQEIEEMSQNQTLLQELRGKIHFLEAKVEQRVKQLETALLCTGSPILSSDASPSSSHESETMHLPCEDGWEMSPRSIHWLEVGRLEEKFGRLIHIDEEILKRNHDLDAKLKKLQHMHDECERENRTLQEKLSEQMMQVSALKSHMEEQKHRPITPQKSHVLSKQLEELKEAYHSAVEKNENLISMLDERSTEIRALQDEVAKNNYTLASLQKTAQAAVNEKEEMEKSKKQAEKDMSCFKYLVLEKDEELKKNSEQIEKLQNQVKELQKETNSLSVLPDVEKEINRKNEQIVSLEKEISTLKELLDNSKEQLEAEKSQVEVLFEQIATLSQENVNNKLSPCKSESTDYSIQALERANLRLSNKLVFFEEKLKEKNSEVSELRDTVTKLNASLQTSERELNYEKAQVDILFEELGSLTVYQKRLEEDLDTVENMMRQKENELATLHEETDAQIKLEAELETLEKELDRQKCIENDLRSELLKMQSELEVSNNALNRESEQWKSRIKDFEDSHQLEIENLKNQLEIYKRNVAFDASEDIDLATLRNEIVEAAKMFRLENTADSQDYGNFIYTLLKKAVDSRLMQMQKDHEENVSSINKSWQHKVQNEYVDKNGVESLRTKYKKEYLEKMRKEAADNELNYQCKLEELKKSLKSSFDEQHSKELDVLHSNLKELATEKNQLEIKVRNLAKQVEKLNENLKTQKDKISQEYQSKISALKQKFAENYENDVKLCDQRFTKKLEKAKMDFEQSLDQEKERHRQEIVELQTMYETRWNNELQKIMTDQMNELKKLNNSKQINLKAVYDQMSLDCSEKLKKVQRECLSQMAEERQRIHLEHKEEIQKIEGELHKQFEEEKRSILLTKERESSALAEALKEKMAEISELKTSLSKNKVYNWEEEKANLESQHKKELNDLKNRLHSKYEKLLQNQIETHDADVKNMEEAYSQRFEEVSELLKIAKRAATGSVLSDSGSNRTTTPSSEITSSDEACSSCREDMLIGNKHLLADKIHQEGKRILRLIESSGLTSEVEKEAHAWLEERAYIVVKLRNLSNDSDANLISLKALVDHLCEEVINARESITNYHQEIITLREKCADLQEKINDNNAKIYILANNLSHQRKLNVELDAQLASSTNEVSALRRSIEENRLTYSDSVRNHSQQFINSTSSSYDVGRLRSADTPKSAENFSMFLPEIRSSPHVKMDEELYPESVKPLLELTSEILSSPEDIELPESQIPVTTSRSGVPQQLSIILKEGRSSSYEAKMHALYWVYRKSRSHNKCLIYQKKYLQMMLQGYILTEKMTLSRVNQMGRNILPEQDNGNSISSVDSPVRGRVLFKSVAYVIVAIQRIKYLVRKWRLFAEVPSSDMVKAEIQSVLQNYRRSSPVMTSNSFNMSYLSLSSRSASVCDGEKVHTGLNSSTSSISSRSRKKAKRSSNSKIDKNRLIEYVQRLDDLQKQLGLDNLR